MLWKPRCHPPGSCIKQLFDALTDSCEVTLQMLLRSQQGNRRTLVLALIKLLRGCRVAEHGALHP